MQPATHQYEGYVALSGGVIYTDAASKLEIWNILWADFELHNSVIREHFFLFCVSFLKSSTEIDSFIDWVKYCIFSFVRRWNKYKLVKSIKYAFLYKK